METSVYYYNIRNFVFTAFTDQTDPASSLPIIRYEQRTSRFVGTEGSLELRMLGDLWFEGKADYLRAELVDENKNLRRIPPLRGTVALEWRHQAFTLRPEMVMANHQPRVFDPKRRQPVMRFST
jgi:hypothetical protein